MLKIENIAGHSFVGDWLPANPIVVDLGANTGRFSLHLIGRFNAKVYAAEAEPVLYQSLVDLGNPALQIKHAAITDRNGELVLNVYEGRCASAYRPLSAVESLEAKVVPAKSLESFLNEYGLDYLDLLKVDIEGAELDVMTEASDSTLLRARQITVEFHEFLYPEMRLSIETIKQRLSRLGFYVIDFSLMNGDVLFIHPAMLIGRATSIYLHASKYKAGLVRVFTRLFGAVTIRPEDHSK